MNTLQKDFSETIRRCEGTIFRICLMFTNRQPEEVKDLYQDIAYNAWMGYRKFRRDSDANTWIYRVAFNTALRKKTTRRKNPPIVSLDDTAYSNLAESAGNELVERLYELIDLLKPDDKKMIFLYLDGVSAKEMSHIVGRPVSTVKKHLQRIKQTLIKLNDCD